MKVRLVALIISLLVFPLVLGAEEYPHHKDIQQGFSPEFKIFVEEMDKGIKKMMEDMHAPGYTGDPDVDFLSMMIPHHEGAIDMARLVLIYGKDPIVRKLAEEIIASQKIEIETIKKRLEIIRKRPDPDPGGFPALEGTRGMEKSP